MYQFVFGIMGAGTVVLNSTLLLASQYGFINWIFSTLFLAILPCLAGFRLWTRTFYTRRHGHYTSLIFHAIQFIWVGLNNLFFWCYGGFVAVMLIGTNLQEESLSQRLGAIWYWGRGTNFLFATQEFGELPYWRVPVHPLLSPPFIGINLVAIVFIICLMLIARNEIHGDPLDR